MALLPRQLKAQAVCDRYGVVEVKSTTTTLYHDRFNTRVEKFTGIDQRGRVAVRGKRVKEHYRSLNAPPQRPRNYNHVDYNSDDSQHSYGLDEEVGRDFFQHTVPSDADENEEVDSDDSNHTQVPAVSLDSQLSWNPENRCSDYLREENQGNNFHHTWSPEDQYSGEEIQGNNSHHTWSPEDRYSDDNPPYNPDVAATHPTTRPFNQHSPPPPSYHSNAEDVIPTRQHNPYQSIHPDCSLTGENDITDSPKYDSDDDTICGFGCLVCFLPWITKKIVLTVFALLVLVPAIILIAITAAGPIQCTNTSLAVPAGAVTIALIGIILIFLLLCISIQFFKSKDKYVCRIIVYWLNGFAIVAFLGLLITGSILAFLANNSTHPDCKLLAAPIATIALSYVFTIVIVCSWAICFWAITCPSN